MKAMVVSLEMFQKGVVPDEVKEYIARCGGAPFIILDESSKIKTNEPCRDDKKSMRTRALLSLNGTGERCILTGTFMSKSPVNAYDQMNFLKRGFFPESMYAFASRYVIRCPLPGTRGTRVTISPKAYAAVHSRLKGKEGEELEGAMDGVRAFYGLTRDECLHIREHAEYTPFRRIDELWRRIGDSVLKVDREDILDMPPKSYSTRCVQLTAEQRRLYLQLQNLHCTDRVAVDSGLKLYLRFQDVCNGYEPVDSVRTDAYGRPHKCVDLQPLKVNPKLDALEEVLEEVGDEQVVVWCSRSKLLYDGLERARSAGFRAGVFDGKVDRGSRERCYEEFMRGELQVLFVNQASGAYGLDGLKNANYAVYLCSSYSAEQRSQSEDRIYRGGAKSTKHIIDIVCRGTCEDRVVDALKRGVELISSGSVDPSVFLL